MTTGSIPLAAVIGSPIAHSLSPRVHGYWLRKYQIPGYYIPIGLSRDHFAKGIDALVRLGFKGANVTLPFKETSLAFADVITDQAALIGAANTLTFRKDGRIQADNTDGYGFVANIRQRAPDWNARSAPAMVIGAGGASRAIISALLNEGVPEILLVNRTRSRAEMLAEHFGARISVVDWTRAPSAMAGIGTLVNTTSLGMEGEPPLNIPLDHLRKTTLVTDIVYTPLETPLLIEAKKRGCVTVDGLGMLLHQAVPGFESWFGIRPEVDDALRQEVLRK